MYTCVCVLFYIFYNGYIGSTLFNKEKQNYFTDGDRTQNYHASDGRSQYWTVLFRGSLPKEVQNIIWTKVYVSEG